MAEFRHRASIDGHWRAPPPATWDAMVDVAEERLTQQLGKPRPSATPRLKTDIVRIQNVTGTDLERGHVVQLGDLYVDAPDQHQLFFDGELPAPDGRDSIAILLAPAIDDDNAEGQMSGVVYCRLNVTHVQHKWADVDAGDTVLQSHWHGRCEILWTETDTTGEQDAVVRIGQAFLGPIRAVVTETGGIAAGGSGEVTIKWGSGLASPTSTETAWLTHMDGGADADEDADCDIYWDPSQQKYVIHALECSG